MLLSNVTIQGFRSIPKNLEFFVNPTLTCLVGANEHGKTNILEAVFRLSKKKFEPDDLYSHSSSDSHPSILYKFNLSRKESKAISEDFREKKLERISKIESLKKIEPQDKQAIKNEGKFVSWYETIEKHYKDHQNPTIKITLEKDGKLKVTTGDLTWELPNTSPQSMIFGCSIPEVRFFSLGNDLADFITLPELESRSNLPFEGLLKLAGIWDKRTKLFGGSIESQRLLVTGGKVLTRRLRNLWTQGEAHTLRLSETNGQLRITIEDPTTLDAPSRRSLGFRSFISFALTLFAEIETLKPRGFVLLMDEPGIHLHPQGQKDLLRELRKLSKNNQIIYTTHSPFMVDRNSPTGTLLVKKEIHGKSKGTRLINKPYGANWEAVSLALGISPSDAFFPPERSLLVEGTSDRLYVTRYMTLCAANTKADLNFLHVIDADRRNEIRGTATMLLSAGRKVVILTDADQGGDDLVKWINRIAGNRKRQLSFINIRCLRKVKKPASIEDLLPEMLWLDTVQKYVKEILKSNQLIDHNAIAQLKKKYTLGRAVAIHLVELGIIKNENDFSKTTVADLFCRLDLKVPDSQTAIFRLCQEITKKLCLNE